MIKVPEKISLSELPPNETFGDSRNDARPFELTDEEIQEYLRASPKERRAIEIGSLGYPLTDA